MKAGRAPRDLLRSAGAAAAAAVRFGSGFLPRFRRLTVALLARLVVLIVARHERLRVARQIGLRLLARGERRFVEGLPVVLAALVRCLHCAAGIAGRCRRCLRGAAGSSGSAAGTVPARPRSGGNSARRAGSNFPPRSDRPRSARRARAEDISRRHDWPCRGSSRRGRSIHRPASAGYDCGGCYYCCCCCCDYCARACACCDCGADADRFSWPVFNNSFGAALTRSSPADRRPPASKIHTLAAALSGHRPDDVRLLATRSR